MSTFSNTFKVAQVSVKNLKNSPLSCHLIFNTDTTSLIFHIHHDSKAPLTTDELLPLFLVLLVELMTVT